MDASRVIQNLDSLWFSTNILTCTDHPMASLTHPTAPPEMVETLISKSCESETEKKDRGRRERRRRRRKRRNHGGVELGFDLKVLTGSLMFELQTRMLPYHDDTAMKEHLRSWAYAVACTVNEAIWTSGGEQKQLTL